MTRFSSGAAPAGANQSAPVGSIDFHLPKAYCARVHLRPGDVLRESGQHYSDMYLLIAGRAKVEPGAGSAAKPTVLEAGSPVGEISFFRGYPATSTVIAETAIDALVIDDATLACLEKEQPAWNAQFHRCFAQITEEKASFNLIFIFNLLINSKSDGIDIYLCRSKAMLESAQRLRYEVFVGELGRDSPYADHRRKLIADELDGTGHTFIAVESGETIGTFRMNFSSTGSLGAIAELYGMKNSAYHPKSTAAGTKFLVKKSKRGSTSSLKLLKAGERYAVRNNIKEIYIDCIPSLVQYYEVFGFRIAGQLFLHLENGPSYPLKRVLS
jgi:predicted GNAT family N-acyltransferase